MTGVEWTGREATALRNAMRLTVERFAQKIGVAPRTVVHWATAPDTVPRLAIRDALDEALDWAGPRVHDRFTALTGTRVTLSPIKISDTERVEVLKILDVISARLNRVEQRLTDQRDVAAHLCRLTEAAGDLQRQIGVLSGAGRA
ncbi:hypothetical protein [Spirillospora sp. NBC_01491]|uniref:hypothetical protein n=1 Tax=Spirillospora sp. NBC_01491 TaxID=2976007 RepID=UPI002E35178D|nr:hypothetical protein [Spirillospora sp. NBC_01491]